MVHRLPGKEYFITYHSKSYIVIPVDLNLIDHGTFTGIIESSQQNDATFQI